MSALSSAPPKDSGTAGAPAAVEFRYTQTESFAALLHELDASLLVSTYQANKLLVVRAVGGGGLDSRNVWARVYLGNTLKDRDRLDEASEHYRQGMILDPNSALPLNGQRGVLMRRGRAEEVLADWQKALADNPPDHAFWFGYAELCLFLGHEEEYRRACKELLDRFGATPDRFIAERTGRACLLLSVEGELHRAAALIDRALASRRPEDGWASRTSCSPTPWPSIVGASSRE
jgi:tetratricopeptide (TPR) repeat protein